MILGVLRVAAVASVLAAAVACSRVATSSGPPAIHLSADGTAVDVTGLPDETLRALRAAAPSDERWRSILAVTVTADAPAVRGSYAIADGAVRFTPAFPLDPGRDYAVSFDASGVAGVPPSGARLSATVGRPGANREPTTVVTRVYPTSEVIPANTLRMYIEFSAPMGRTSGVEHIRLLDDRGREVKGAVLPLDYEFWSPDHRRFTVFFDPGRVKQGILPNREMGRAFTPGGTATLVVGREWRDEQGLPLKEEYRRTFRVGDAQERALDPADWRVNAPAASGRDPVVVTFPAPLDRSLLLRAVGVRRDGRAVAGDVQIGDGEMRWSFTPRDPWRRGSYEVLALDILEDVAGNQVGRAFEVDNFDTVDKDPDPKEVTLPFEVR